MSFRAIIRIMGLLAVYGILVTRYSFVPCAHAQFPPKCDSDKSCVGTAITISVTSGKGAQYVDVDTSYLLDNLGIAMTFEAWIAPQPQPGKTQYIAGLWGPNQDNNDQWVLFIKDNQITFELSKDNSYKGETDNTIAMANVPDLYTNGWRHVAAEWDAGTTEARIYLDGMLVASATNPVYPLTKLHVPEDPVLPLQIGSCNGLYDDTVKRRAFLGQIDEVRLWNRSLSQNEIACGRLISLIGNEAGLALYYRCNETASNQFLCDGSGNDHLGLLRSGAVCDSSNRTIPLTYSVQPTLVNTSVTCTEDTDLTFTMTDTSVCGDKVNLILYGPDKGLFTLSQKQFTLVQGVPQPFTVHFHTDLIGPVASGVAVENANSCGDPIFIPINIDRKTQLQYSFDRLKLDTLYVGCQTVTSSSQTLTICNPGPGTVTVSKISLDSNHFTWNSPGLSLPKVLNIGDCITLTVTMNDIDSSHTFLDTLRIASNELCPGSGVIPVYGRVQDVLGILEPDGKTELDSMDFGEVCPGFVSGTTNFEYRDLASDTLVIDTAVYNPTDFFGAVLNFPLKLLPKTANQLTYARFKPSKPGPLVGTLTVTGEYHGCEIIKTVALTGKGYSVDVDFLTPPPINFGPVTIGKTSQLAVQAVDSGPGTRNIDSYLHIGDVFTIIGGKSFAIAPNQQLPITILFRPRQPITYYDTLSIFDEGCYEVKSIPIQGTGIFKAFQFTPSYLDLTGVVGCASESGPISMQNVSGQTLTITSCVLNDPTGKFSVTGLNIPSTFTNQQTWNFNVTYTPNDVNLDRADEAYIDVTLSDGEVYQIILRGTSLAPRLYVTPLTPYGLVEVGTSKQNTILLQNASNVYEHVDSVLLPNGYSLISSNPSLPATIGPRDSIWIVVQFAPDSAMDYDGNLSVFVDSPCTNTYTGQLTGTGEVVSLDVPISFMNYGLVRPCDCGVRDIPLANYSHHIPIVLDSIWINGLGVTLLTPGTFHWDIKSSGKDSLPVTLDTMSYDTLEVTFCPNIPAINANLTKIDTLHIEAHTPGWSDTFETILSGEREMNFQPTVTTVQFPATRVDTSAKPQNVGITVPGVNINPDGDSVVIDNVSFQPDQKVFTVVASTGAPLPWIIHRGQKGFAIKVNFLPRAPKIYTARMLIHTVYPCNSTDTTVLVMGSGFAPAFGLQMAFDTARVGLDTMRLTTCDTLSLPVMLNRDIPQEYMNVYFHLGFDTTELQLLNGSSPFTDSVYGADTADGAHIALVNGINIKAGTITTLKFKVIGGAKIFPITLDGINFDSDSLVFFEIVAGVDHGVVEIDQPMIAVTKMTVFDTVDVKDCKSETVTVYNTGVIPVRFDSLSLPIWHKVTASSKPIPATLQPGDSVQLTVTFCPRDSIVIDTTITAISDSPCVVIDTGTITGVGYAPPYPFRMLTLPDIGTGDTISGIIMDTVSVPIVIDHSIPLTPLDVRFTLHYDARALEYLSVTSPYAEATINNVPGTIAFTFPESQNIDSGEFARVKFLMTVPDSAVSTLSLAPGKFTSDSIMFIKPRPTGDTSLVYVGPHCDVSTLSFVGGSNALAPVQPNPSSDIVSVDVSFMVDANAQLDIINSLGTTVMKPLDGSAGYKAGTYRITFDTHRLSNGAYSLVFRAGDFQAVERFMVIK
ncbi:MAG TPA: choice-of-anchor D domain-containing protein [Candidatus Kapabacteria bacterium]